MDFWLKLFLFDYICTWTAAALALEGWRSSWWGLWWLYRGDGGSGCWWWRSPELLNRNNDWMEWDSRPWLLLKGTPRFGGRPGLEKEKLMDVIIELKD